MKLSLMLFSRKREDRGTKAALVDRNESKEKSLTETQLCSSLYIIQG